MEGCGGENPILTCRCRVVFGEARDYPSPSLRDRCKKHDE